MENELNELSEKGTTKDLTNKYSILNGAKNGSSGVLQNYLVFISFNKYIKFLNKTQEISLRKSKLLLVGNELNELSEKGAKKDLTNKYSIFNGAKYFSSGVLQNYLVFISFNKYIKFLNKTQKISLRKSKGMSKESIKNPPGSDNNFSPSLVNSYPYQI